MENLYKSPQLYDLFHPDNEEPLRRHYSNIFENKDIKTIFDCSIGTGNLTLALADMGYEVAGSDISTDMLEQAKEKSIKRNLHINLYQADFRAVNEITEEKFDCVMSTGNSLPHVNNDDVKTTLKAMSQMIKQGGYLYFDLRNWDRILKEKQRFFLYTPLIKDDLRTNVVMVKDYIEDSKVRFNFLYSFEKENKIIGKEERVVEYYPIKKELIINSLKELGFVDFELYNFIHHQVTNYEEMQWYGIICRKA